MVIQTAVGSQLAVDACAVVCASHGIDAYEKRDVQPYKQTNAEDMERLRAHTQAHGHERAKHAAPSTHTKCRTCTLARMHKPARPPANLAVALREGPEAGGGGEDAAGHLWLVTEVRTCGRRAGTEG